MCLCLRNTTDARERPRAFLGSFPPWAHDFFSPSLSRPLSLLFFLFSSSSRSPYVLSRGVRRANHSCQWSPRAFVTSRILHVEVSSSGYHRASVRSCWSLLLDLLLLLFFAVFCLLFRPVFDEKPRQVKLLIALQHTRDSSCFSCPFRFSML